MKPTFLLETDTFDDGNPEKMGEVLTEMGIPWSYVKYAPSPGAPLLAEIEFVKPSQRYHKLAKHYVKHGFECPVDSVGEWLPTIFYGSLNCAKYLQRTRRPSGIWLDLPSFRCQNYYVHYGEYLIGQRYAMFPVEEIMRNADRIFFNYAVDDHLFIRPDEGDKPFNGEVVFRDKLQEWYEYTSKYDDPAKNIYKLAVVASPVHILREWRLVIFNGEVVTGSLYRKRVEGRSSVEIEEGYDLAAGLYAEEIVKEAEWTPHPLFVMDIAEIMDPATLKVSMGLIEIGAINTCGLYACDIKKVVTAMLAAGETNAGA